jgi:hypothetical protein
MKHRISHTNLTFSKVLVCLVLLGISVTAGAGTLYKWIDENGEVRYSDRMPANQVKREHQTLNSQGVVITTKSAAKTEEEIAPS